MQLLPSCDTNHPAFSMQRSQGGVKVPTGGDCTSSTQPASALPSKGQQIW